MCVWVYTGKISTHKVQVNFSQSSCEFTSSSGWIYFDWNERQMQRVIMWNLSREFYKTFFTWNSREKNNQMKFKWWLVTWISREDIMPVYNVVIWGNVLYWVFLKHIHVHSWCDIIFQYQPPYPLSEKCKDYFVSLVL